MLPAIAVLISRLPLKAGSAVLPIWHLALSICHLAPLRGLVFQHPSGPVAKPGDDLVGDGAAQAGEDSPKRQRKRYTQSDLRR